MSKTWRWEKIPLKIGRKGEGIFEWLFLFLVDQRQLCNDKEFIWRTFSCEGLCSNALQCIFLPFLDVLQSSINNIFKYLVCVSISQSLRVVTAWVFMSFLCRFSKL